VIIIASGRSSGLFPVYCLPIPPKAGQWRSVNISVPPLAERLETYSYGDSAGFAPDFPFNPAKRGPDAANVME